MTTIFSPRLIAAMPMITTMAVLACVAATRSLIMIYEEITKDADRNPKQKSGGCLSMLVMVLVSMGVFILLKII